jgi:opacity protein-like surface antigen
MKSMLLAGAALAAVFAATGAQAATDGWYGAVDIGYSFPFKISTTSGTPATGFNTEKFGLSPNGTADIRVGYQVQQQLAR